jgi:hypothetical protein
MGGAQVILAFAVAAAVTGLELITTKYPRTSMFVLRVKWFYAYVLIYGVLGAVAYSLLPLLAGEVTLTGIGLSNPWVTAGVVGFSIKAFLHIRIFTVSTGPGSQPLPVGLETIVQIFEPWMLKNLDLAHWLLLVAFVTPRAAKFQTAAEAQARATANPPPNLSQVEQAAFAGDIAAAKSPAQVILDYINYGGIAATKQFFPE